MTAEWLQEQCEVGQRQLMETQYLEAIQTLSIAENFAWTSHDYETLSRLYMPLQEARRQARQRCAEGQVNLRVIAENPEGSPDPRTIVQAIPQGQLLVAGWGSIEPAKLVRKLAAEQKRYLECFLAAIFPIAGGGRAVVVAPLEEIALPSAEPRSIDALIRLLPAHSLILNAEELPPVWPRGTTESFARVSAMWEQLHQPFLAAADMTIDPVARMDAYRKTIRVDSACELAHQNLAAVAKNLWGASTGR